MLESAVAKAPASRRAALKKQMKLALAKHREDLKRTLAEALKKPFMNWCLRAAGDPDQKKLLKRTARCLKSPDCQTYGTCLEAVMKSAEKAFFKGFTPPRLSPSARTTGDATKATSGDPNTAGSATTGDGGGSSPLELEDGGVHGVEEKTRPKERSARGKGATARSTSPSRKEGKKAPRGRPAQSR